MRRPRILEEIDRALCRLYRLDRDACARHYVTAVIAPNFTGDLLIRQRPEELELAIRFESRLLERLGEVTHHTNPREYLPALSVALEEVSHFRYLVDRAQRDHAVTPLELEIQGEVDRFVLLYFWQLRGGPHDARSFYDLQAVCFGDFRLARTLSREESQRYREAHAVASKLVGKMSRVMADRNRLLPWLRQLYRQSLTDKIAAAA